MSDKPDNPFQFWEELKRRKVVRVIIGYLAAAYVILELTSIIAEPWGLPAWTINLVSILLIIGLVVAIVISWIFDLTPEGIKKTESSKSLKGKSQRGPVKRKLRASDIIIAILLVAVVVLLYPRLFKKDKLKGIRDSDGRISISVMPFTNMTGDTILNIWETGLQYSIISKLSNIAELSVRQPQTMFDIIETSGHTNFASLTPSIASDIALKLETNTFLYGGIVKAGNKIRISSQLRDSQTGEIFKSFEVDGDTEDDFIEIIDSLSFLIRNHLEIEVMSKDASYDENVWANTQSPEAYRYFLRGLSRFFVSDYSSAIDLFSEAIKEDTTFVNGKLFLMVAYNNVGQNDKAIKIINEVNENINNITYFEQLLTKYWKAHYDKNPQECIRVTKLMLDDDEQQRGLWFNLGYSYNSLYQYENAADAFEKALELDEKWGGNWKWMPIYASSGSTYHIIGNHTREREIYELALTIEPDNQGIIRRLAVCALSLGDTIEAGGYITNYFSLREGEELSETQKQNIIGNIYRDASIIDKAEQYYLQALGLDPEYAPAMYNLASLYFANDIYISRGMDLINEALKIYPESSAYIQSKAWGLYRQGKYEESLELLNKAWDLRRFYNHKLYLDIKEVKQALAKQKSEIKQ